MVFCYENVDVDMGGLKLEIPPLSLPYLGIFSHLYNSFFKLERLRNCLVLDRLESFITKLYSMDVSLVTCISFVFLFPV